MKLSTTTNHQDAEANVCSIWDPGSRQKRQWASICIRGVFSICSDVWIQAHYQQSEVSTKQWAGRADSEDGEGFTQEVWQPSSGCADIPSYSTTLVQIISSVWVDMFVPRCHRSNSNSFQIGHTLPDSRKSSQSTKVNRRPTMTRHIESGNDPRSLKSGFPLMDLQLKALSLGQLRLHDHT